MAVFAPGLDGLCEDTPDFREAVGTAAFVSCALLGTQHAVSEHELGCLVPVTASPGATSLGAGSFPWHRPSAPRTSCLPSVLGVLPHNDCHLKTSPPFAELFPCQLDPLFNRECSSSLQWKHPTRGTLLRTGPFFFTQ